MRKLRTVGERREGAVEGATEEVGVDADWEVLGEARRSEELVVVKEEEEEEGREEAEEEEKSVRGSDNDRASGNDRPWEAGAKE